MWRCCLATAALLGAAAPAVAQDATQQELEASAAGPSTVGAETDLDERAQKHWGSGMAYLDEGDYSKALEAFNKAYELSGRARILLAVAVTHERRGDLARAIATLDEYLRLAPSANNVAAITAHRNALQVQHDEQLRQLRNAQALETGSSREPGRKESAAGAGTGAHSQDAVSSAGTGLSANAGNASAPPGKRVPSKDPLKWSAMGVGIAAGVGAAVSGILAFQKSDELEHSCGATKACTRQETQPGRTMAWVSTALTGVALAGLGLGLWLVLDEPSDATQPSASTHRLQVGLSYRPTGLTPEVTWSF